MAEFHYALLWLEVWCDHRESSDARSFFVDDDDWRPEADFGFVHCLIRFSEMLIDYTHWRGRGDSDTCCDLQCTVFQMNRLSSLDQNILCNPVQIYSAREIWQCMGNLVIAPSCNDAATIRSTLRSSTNFSEEGITRRVTVAVVNRLENVQINQEQRPIPTCRFLGHQRQCKQSRGGLEAP